MTLILTTFVSLVSLALIAVAHKAMTPQKRTVPVRKTK
jgi:hypothetical protein